MNENIRHYYNYNSILQTFSREVAQRLGDDNDSDFIAEDREGEERGESPTIARPIVTNWLVI